VKVVRNTLLKRAVEGTQFDVLNDVFKGPTLIASPTNIRALLPVSSRSSPRVRTSSRSRRCVRGQFLAANQIDVLATLPTYNEAVAQLMSVIQGATSKLARTLAAIRDQKEATAA
jgi:Ribosomal protein L10